MDMKRILTLILMLALSNSVLIGLSGCGKKGPLYLEKDKATETEKDQSKNSE